MSKSISTMPIINLVVSLVTLGVVLYMVLFYGGSPVVDHTVQKNLAGELADNNLPRAAIEEYSRILDDKSIDNETRANIYYMTAKLYFEELQDYEKAAAHYIRARSLNPDGSFYAEAGKNLVACMERMGRVIDAKRALDRTVNLDSAYAEHKGDTLVAKIGDMPIFLSELDDRIQKLPPEIQKEHATRQGKLVILNDYIGMELVYRAAVRDGLNSDPEIVKAQKELARQLVVDRYISDKIMPLDEPDSLDLYNHYVAHKDDRYSGNAYDEVQYQVYRDYQQDKFRKAFSDYVSTLAEYERVKIFEENVR